jgi:helix-turn-helix protein
MSARRDRMDLHATARTLRSLTEPIAAGVYFAPEAIDGYAALGLNYFEGYFCSRSACLGEAPWSVVCAAFAAFKPAAVESAVTGGWAKTNAATLLDARLAGATAQLERLIGDIAAPDDVARATALLYELTDGVDPSGRMLYSGLSALPRPTTPFGALWHAADLVREHRGDGHIAAWIPHVDSTEITVLTELAWEIPPRSYVFTRGWSPEEVDAAYARLQERGLVEGESLTAAGAELREEIEQDTDRANREVVERLAERSDELFTLLGPWARAIVDGGGYPADPRNLRVNG